MSGMPRFRHRAIVTGSACRVGVGVWFACRVVAVRACWCGRVTVGVLVCYGRRCRLVGVGVLVSAC